MSEITNELTVKISTAAIIAAACFVFGVIVGGLVF